MADENGPDELPAADRQGRRSWTYTGPHPLHLVGYGDLKPGDTFKADEELSLRLVNRPDFKSARAPKTR